MPRAARPFTLPRSLETDLAQVSRYWSSLLRGRASMPFSDDVRTNALGRFADHTFLVDVMDRPRRCRFAQVGKAVARAYGDAVEGLFLDEVEPSAPLEFLASQASATVEAARPTYYRHVRKGEPGYGRILMPAWGNGRVELLLGAITWDTAQGAS
jgi:hypothetical protein